MHTIRSGAILALTYLAMLAGAHGQVSVLTYHNDTWRSGHNNQETKLTTAAVAASFGPLGTVPVDGQVDAQPLVVANGIVAGDPNPGTHDVVYVATKNNSVYAIDPVHLTVLAKTNLGPTAPILPGCTNDAPNVGITSTPVIDTSLNALFVMAYVQTTNGPAYVLHALSLTTLADTIPPQTVAASTVLEDGKTMGVFNATYQRQRPALLEAGRVIYAAFGSFCDLGQTKSRGWLLGWHAATLEPLQLRAQPGTQQAFTPTQQVLGNKLGSIWMSGFGPAYDAIAGGIYFVTGNGNATDYDGKHNVQESAIRYSQATNTVQDLFTPYQQATWDSEDKDFGSGGLMLLPPRGSLPTLAVAAGKSGTMYLMTGSNLGGFTPGGPDHVLDAVAIGGCWCGPSTFDAPAGRTIVSSGGNTVMLWTLVTSPSISLQQGPTATIDGSPQDPGFFTTISSNGMQNTIIWALSRAQAKTGNITLYAIQAVPSDGRNALHILYHAPAGVWTDMNSNANLSATVANGYVYVGSAMQLAVFGLKASGNVHRN
jgi:hypothetical protein